MQSFRQVVKYIFSYIYPRLHYNIMSISTLSIEVPFPASLLKLYLVLGFNIVVSVSFLIYLVLVMSIRSRNRRNTSFTATILHAVSRAKFRQSLSEP
jgi:hypothetical protein